MKTVRIYGMASNLVFAPPVPPGVEVWCCNNPLRSYSRYRANVREEYTRWFNLHSRRHMTTAYPRGYAWFGTVTKPVYLQDVQGDVPASVKFPKDELLAFFGHRFVTFTGAWEFALAIYERFERIECYGFRLRDKTVGSNKECYAFERPCFFYWVEEARRRGIEVVIPAEVGEGVAGDPHAYTGPLYGYETT
jgi:hypothetical protein